MNKNLFSVKLSKNKQILYINASIFFSNLNLKVKKSLIQEIKSCIISNVKGQVVKKVLISIKYKN